MLDSSLVMSKKGSLIVQTYQKINIYPATRVLLKVLKQKIYSPKLTEELPTHLSTIG